jgi:hypothetical protein
MPTSTPPPVYCNANAVPIEIRPADAKTGRAEVIVLANHAWLELKDPYVADLNTPFVITLRSTDRVSICLGPNQVPPTNGDPQLCGSAPSIVINSTNATWIYAYAFGSGDGTVIDPSCKKVASSKTKEGSSGGATRPSKTLLPADS